MTLITAAAGVLAFWLNPAPAETPAQKTSPANAVAAGVFSSATAAYREGVSAVQSGAVDKGVPALRFAADRGVLGAQLRLAELYAKGGPVPKDDAQAFTYYRQIADTYADIPPRSPVAKYVADAFVALGRYQLAGIPQIGLRPDPKRAADLFGHAASYFGDADAQYELAQLYLSGNGVKRNLRLGANWLAMAARKQHPESQAMLGEMLWRSEKGSGRYIRGLALIALAHHNSVTTGNEPAWIKDLYAEAFSDIDDETRQAVEATTPRWGGPRVAIVSAHEHHEEMADERSIGSRIGGFVLGDPIGDLDVHEDPALTAQTVSDDAIVAPEGIGEPVISLQGMNAAGDQSAASASAAPVMPSDMTSGSAGMGVSMGFSGSAAGGLQ
ncbi:tetratricopeptide repeat protein [Methyloligella halotolerans]|uniref:tetratricopeptide repeat protein n=1 Tax=Methyloligella halotolerans TaxID=1177755 RepID=UPI001470DA8A|nr:tetratricopeptide repeat protein [Methyloligella halotolerans]